MAVAAPRPATLFPQSFPDKEKQQRQKNMEQIEPETQLFVDAARDAARNGLVPEQVRKAAEDGVKRAHAAYTNLNSAAQEGTQPWKRMLHANYETAREMEGICCRNTSINIDAAFAAAGAMASARTFPEAAQLYSKFVQQQWSAGSAQIQELLAISQRASRPPSA
jgi:hypothetical protein